MMTATPPLGSPAGSAEREDLTARSTLLERKRWLLPAIGLVIVALAYGVGRVQGALALSALKEEAAQDRRAVQAQVAACETARHLLEARRSLSLVALSLDRRNFGVAENHRRAALQMLQRPSASGVTKAAELANTIQALNLAVDPDPGAERQQVIAVSEALDAVLVDFEGRPSERAVRTAQ